MSMAMVPDENYLAFNLIDKKSRIIFRPIMVVTLRNVRIFDVVIWVCAIMFCDTHFFRGIEFGGVVNLMELNFD